MGKATLCVHLKEGMYDPEGAKTKEALHLLGFTGIGEIRVGKLYEIEMAEATPAKVAQLCEALLANPVIERHEILGLEG
jgi:phosphoribosylformylglycinamidine synthase